MQSTIADFIRQVYLFVADGGEGELDLPEDVAVKSGPGLFDRLQIGIYRGYVERQATPSPRSIAVVRRIRQGGSSEEVAARWGHVQLGTVRACALIGQNIRFLLLALTVVPGWPEGFLWITLIPLNLVLLVLLRRHESRVTELARTGDLPSIPLAGVA